jgi:glutamate-1-semialdehyde 2,1-aminomutase
VLVFDEVITGFRLARGGAQEREGVLPDITVLGKIVGGGFPLAAFGGRGALMDHLAPTARSTRRARCRATRSRWPPASPSSSCSPTRSTTQLEAITIRLADAFAAAFAHAGIVAQVVRHGTLAGVVVTDRPPRRYEDVAGADHDTYARFFHAMLDRGVYLAPSGYEVLFTSLALDDAALATIATAAEEAARAIAR